MAPVCPSSVLSRLSSTPLHPLLSLPCLKQRIVGDCLVGSRVCVGRDPGALGIIVPLQDHQNLHVTKHPNVAVHHLLNALSCSVLHFLTSNIFNVLYIKLFSAFPSWKHMHGFKNTTTEKEILLRQAE